MSNIIKFEPKKKSNHDEFITTKKVNKAIKQLGDKYEEEVRKIGKYIEDTDPDTKHLHGYAILLVSGYFNNDSVAMMGFKVVDRESAENLKNYLMEVVMELESQYPTDEPPAPRTA